MPFPTRVIPNRTDIKDVLQNNQVKNILEKTSVSNMIGLLQQLNMLSQHSSEIFSDLLKDTLESSKRIQKVKSRIQTISSKIEPIESLYLTNPPNFFYDNPYTEQQWLRKDNMRGFLFSREKAPQAINKRRSICDIPPDLSALDQFTKDKQPCIKKYSDTDFFMNEWIEEQKAKLEEEKRKRKLRKEAKRKRKKLKRAKTKKIMKVQKKVYSALGAEFKGEEQKQEEYVETRHFDIDGKDLMSNVSSNKKKSTKSSKKSSPQQQQQQKRTSVKQQQQTQQLKQQVTPQQPKQMQQVQTKTNSNVPPPNPMKQNTSSPNVPPPNPMQGNNNVPPPNPMQTGGPPPNPMQNNSNVPPPNPMQSNGGPPPNPMQSQHSSQPSYVQTAPPTFNPTHVPTETTDLKDLGPMTPQMRIMLSMQQAEKQREEEERLKKLRDEEYEKKKQQANMLVPGRSNMLLAGIKTGVQLKKIGNVKREKPKDSRSLLMQSLQKGANLRKVNKEELQKPKDEKPKEGGIFEILKRRQLIADSSSEESGSDWGSEDE